MMKPYGMWIVILSAALAGLLSSSTRGDDLAITSFTADGVMTWSYPTNGLTEYRVDATENVESGVWTNSLAGVAPRSSEMSVALPMTDSQRFFRLVGSTFPTNRFMVVDLSAGSAASTYPVSFLSAVPTGGWTDVHKTTKLVLRRITAGTFIMGSPEDELGRNGDETRHQVALTQPFYIGIFEITQKQWERVMGSWPSYFNNVSCRDARPVEMVSYNAIRGASAGAAWPANSSVDADSFMGRLRSRTGRAFDLPTESQWEYAGRAGTTTALNSGKNLTSTGICPNMSEVGRYWYNGGSGYGQTVDTSGATAKVGTYLPNAWGLYDVHGNVWEWCLDWYGDYPGTVSDPKGPSAGQFGSYRVFRGGCWGGGAYYCRVGARINYYRPDNANYSGLGFRAVLPVGQ